MDFYTKDSYSLEDIQSLIANEVEENVRLDYKSAGALSSSDKERKEITKDVSSFANSDGGIIVYGVAEVGNKPKEITPIDGRVYTKEWLENIIQSIQPRIDGIKIIPIRVNRDDQSVYVVQIPRSDNAPHMAKDNRYYKRFNFKSAPMEDYEVKDLFHRVSAPNIKIERCSLVFMGANKDQCEYQLTAQIKNQGKQPCSLYKLNFYLNQCCFDDISSTSSGNDFSYTIINEQHRFKLGVSAQEAIFPSETLDMGHISILVSKKNVPDFTDKLVIDMILFYQGGQDQLAYIPSTDEYIEDRAEISQILQEMSTE